ncbi:hypothetical protein B0H16DRAFT_1401757 [Mycena metata]|uniref:F-box domain-containing protein n=1 Tax=Mycena metata TaxID=1033252 RepID=A0AAD7KJX6_9AGAR|nr:hypothetical protein B0H16DRAFT_1401757 [Mycena metata]
MSSDTNAPRKKRKTSDGRTSRARKPILSRLTGMPIDILFEIFGYCHPYDVLRLARVTKALRGLLLHKSASSVWRTARENLVPSMPEKPSDMSEPAWIHLVFDPVCHFCCAKGLRVVDWRLRVRICAKCTKIHMETAEPTPWNNSPESFIESMIPRRVGKKGEISYLSRDYQDVANELFVLNSPRARNSFAVARRELIKTRDIHAERCELWAQDKVSDRSKELEEVRKERQAAIINKLIGLGYEEDLKKLEYPSNLKFLSEFTRTQALTERIWKNIEGPVVAYVENSRQKRLARLRFSERSKPLIRLYQQFKNSLLPYNEIMPGPVDLCNMAKVAAILNSPPDAKIDESSFVDIVPMFNSLAAQWNTYTHLRLLHHTQRVEDKNSRITFLLGFDQEDKHSTFKTDRKSLKPLEKMIPELMKSLVFVCDNCTPPQWDSIGDDTFYFERDLAEPLYYPEVLDHHCLTRNLNYRDRTECSDSLKHLEHYDRDRGSWSCRILSIEKSLGRIFEAIVTIAGQDPGSTGAQDMDKLDMWFACMHPACLTAKLDNNGFWAYACNWRGAVKHHAEEHPEETPDFEALSSYNVDFCRSRLRPLADLVVPPADWLCAHCRDTPAERPPATIDAVKEHLKAEHDLMSPQPNQDCYERFGAPLRPAFGKGPLGDSLEVFRDIPQLKVAIIPA